MKYKDPLWSALASHHEWNQMTWFRPPIMDVWSPGTYCSWTANFHLGYLPQSLSSNHCSTQSSACNTDISSKHIRCIATVLKGLHRCLLGTTFCSEGQLNCCTRRRRCICELRVGNLSNMAMKYFRTEPVMSFAVTWGTVEHQELEACFNSIHCIRHIPFVLVCPLGNQRDFPKWSHVALQTFVNLFFFCFYFQCFLHCLHCWNLFSECATRPRACKISLFAFVWDNFRNVHNAMIHFGSTMKWRFTM